MAPNNGMQRTALRAAADAHRSAAYGTLPEAVSVFRTIGPRFLRSIPPRDHQLA